MIHLGDITKINGHDVPTVDVITGGSPCQDLSVAGKRAGLAGERSGLFMEQMRIIKEMRDESAKELRSGGTDFTVRDIKPRFMVWENVPGAFSSNKGEDFRCVLEETARIADKNTIIPRPEGGRWSPSGCIMADGWSIAWRVHDAQFWGVPQRRKRISVVADFGGQSAPEILFERKGMSGDPKTCREQREEITKAAGGGFEETISFQERAGKPGGGKGILIQNERTGALSTLNNQSVCAPGLLQRRFSNVKVFEDGISPTLEAGAGEGGNNMPMVYGISSYDSNAMKSKNPNSGIYEAETARTLDLNGGSPACNQGGMAVVQGFDAYNQQSTGNVTMSITGAATDSHHIPCVIEGNGSRPSHKGDGYSESETMYTLNSTEHHAVYSIGHDIRSAKFTDDEITDPLTATDYKDPIKINCPQGQTYQKIVGTIDCGITKGTGNQLANQDMFVTNTSVVRRLTPMECERLQGYPDHWTDIGEWTDSKGKKHKDADSPRYKALGNSIALPFWDWMAGRICRQYNRPIKMASLFDGIGGFPLVFSRHGADPVWASEIEEFPIAVTKIRFPEKI